MTSEELFKEANDILVGGVNSPVRAFKAVGGHPIFIKSAKGPHLFSHDGQQYVDYVAAFGPHILGHASPHVLTAIEHAIKDGLSFGAPTQIETTLAKKIQEKLPSLEKLRFVNSGTEATMSAIRLARGFSKKNKIIKFNGCYHGHTDSLLVAAGSGALTLGQPDSAGVPAEFIQHTAVLPYNDTAALQTYFDAYKDDIAGVILEPICGNMGVITPSNDFLNTLQTLCKSSGALLIFDEVMTGFRVHPSSAQGYLNVTPDITCLGKIIGGGLPCGAYGGRADIMDKLAPVGPVYQAGTLSGNPIVMAAGLATISALDNAIYTHLETIGAAIEESVNEIKKQRSLPITVNRVGSMFSLFFTEGPVQNLDDVNACNLDEFKRFYQHMLSAGIYLGPSQYEANFISSAHTEAEVDQTISAINSFFS